MGRAGDAVARLAGLVTRTLKQTSDGLAFKHLQETPVSRTLYDFTEGIDGGNGGVGASLKSSAYKDWTVYSDKSIGGRSEGTFSYDATRRCAVFAGNLSLYKPERLDRSGFVHLKSPIFDPFADWTTFDALEIRIKADERVYVSNIKSDTPIADDLHQYIVHPPKTGEWCDIILPFNEYFLTIQGKVEGEQFPLNKDKVQHIGFLMAERREGPFELCIERVRAIKSREVRESRRYNFGSDPEM